MAQRRKVASVPQPLLLLSQPCLVRKKERKKGKKRPATERSCIVDARGMLSKMYGKVVTAPLRVWILLLYNTMLAVVQPQVSVSITEKENPTLAP